MEALQSKHSTPMRASSAVSAFQARQGYCHAALSHLEHHCCYQIGFPAQSPADISTDVISNLPPAGISSSTAQATTSGAEQGWSAAGKKKASIDPATSRMHTDMLNTGSGGSQNTKAAGACALFSSPQTAQSTCNSDSSPSQLGRVPANQLLDRFMYSSFVSLCKAVGMLPVSQLLPVMFVWQAQSLSVRCVLRTAKTTYILMTTHHRLKHTQNGSTHWVHPAARQHQPPSYRNISMFNNIPSTTARAVGLSVPCLMFLITCRLAAGAFLVTTAMLEPHCCCACRYNAAAGCPECCYCFCDHACQLSGSLCPGFPLLLCAKRLPHYSLRLLT